MPRPYPLFLWAIVAAMLGGCATKDERNALHRRSSLEMGGMCAPGIAGFMDPNGAADTACTVPIGAHEEIAWASTGGAAADTVSTPYAIGCDAARLETAALDCTAPNCSDMNNYPAVEFPNVEF